MFELKLWTEENASGLFASFGLNKEASQINLVFVARRDQYAGPHLQSATG
jgi:hypothetical protein